MARIPEDEIIAVRRKADIVTIIGKYLQLHKNGKDYKCVCPFHNDHDPSLNILPEKQIYKCFVCGAGGNVFTFIQNYEHVSFPQAVQKVADMIGYDLSVRTEDAAVPVDENKKRLYEVLKETIKYTTYQLTTNEASQYMEYLEKRGLTKEICAKFEIGYDPKGDQLLHFLTAKGYRETDMTECNVVRTTSSGLHDVFFDRITFPIHDVQGNPIGFSARSIDPQNKAKYINTNDTPVFHKSDLVYNAHRAKDMARRTGVLYVCEGVTDVIAFAQAGLENAVCTLGTSCTEHQIRVLKSLALTIVFCYDGDEAGQRATMRAGRMAMQAGCQISIVENKTGKDPDEILRENGAEALQELASRKISWMEFVLKYLLNHTNLDSYLEKKEMVKKALDELQFLPDDFDKRQFIDELAKTTGFNLNAEIGSIRNSGMNSNQVPATRLHAQPSVNGTDAAEDQILAMMLKDVRAAGRFQDKLGFLENKEKNALAMLMVDYYRRTSVSSVPDMIDLCVSQDQKNMLTSLLGTWAYESEYSQEMMDGAIRKVLYGMKRQQADQICEQLNQPMNATSKEILLREYQACLQELRRYIDEENAN